MMGIQAAPERLFYDFCLDDHVPDDHLLRRIDRFLDFGALRTSLRPYYSHLGRPSVDPEIGREYDEFEIREQVEIPEFNLRKNPLPVGDHPFPAWSEKVE